MKKRFLFVILITCTVHSSALRADGCPALDKIPQSDLHKISPEKILECMAQGHDPNWEYRPNITGMAPAGQSDTFQMSRCDPSGVCKNSTGSRTENSQLPPGYDPANNPSLNIPEIPWGEAPNVPLPCGAVGGLSEIALQTLWGNVKINMPAQGKTLINNKLKNLLGKLFGKKTNCQDGTFWASLNNLLNVILPALGLKAPGFTFDRSNNTFLTPPDTFIGMPLKSTFTLDLSASDSYFILPAGGSFYDAHGKKIFIEDNSTVQFMQSGQVITSQGGQYQVQAGGQVTLDPNGIVGVPPGTPLAVPPQTTLFPMGPATKAPAWVKSPEPVDSPADVQAAQQFHQ